MLRTDMTIDHVTPLSKGGADDTTNYRLAHSRCNAEKGNAMPTKDQLKRLGMA